MSMQNEHMRVLKSTHFEEVPILKSTQVERSEGLLVGRACQAIYYSVASDLV